MPRIKLPVISCKFGAPMGRPNARISGKCKLQRCPMARNGVYDTGGAYWGLGRIIWVCQDAEGALFFARAKTREEAKKITINSTLTDDVTFYK